MRESSRSCPHVRWLLLDVGCSLLCARHLMHFAFIYGHWMRVTQRFPTVPLPHDASCSATSSVRPFHQKARKAESHANPYPKIQKTKIYPHCEIYSLGISRKYFTLSQKGNLTSATSFFRFAMFAFMNGLCFLGSQSTQKILRFAVLHVFLSGDLNKLQFG